jgi:hypothetical protein
MRNELWLIYGFLLNITNIYELNLHLVITYNL